MWLNRKKERNYSERSPGGSAGKESTCNAGDLGLIPGWGRFPREGKGYPFQYSGLENSMDCIVHRVTKSRTKLTNFHFTFSKSKNSVARCLGLNSVSLTGYITLGKLSFLCFSATL